MHWIIGVVATAVGVDTSLVTDGTVLVGGEKVGSGVCSILVTTEQAIKVHTIPRMRIICERSGVFMRLVLKRIRVG